MLVMVVVAALVVMVVVMVVMLLLPGVGGVVRLRLGEQLCDQIALAVHDRYDLRAGQGVPVGGHDGGGGVLFCQQRHGLGNFVLAGGGGAAQDDAGRMADLIIVELAEVLHIHFDLVHVRDGHKAVQLHGQLRAHALHSAGDVAQLADARRLDQDTVGVVGFHDLLQRLAEVADQAAADAAGVQLVDLNACLAHKAAVNADLAEFVFDQHDLLPGEGFFDELFDQRGFACAQKAGKNVDFRFLFCHGCLPLFLYQSIS